jgi:hypothetical protein
MINRLINTIKAVSLMLFIVIGVSLPVNAQSNSLIDNNIKCGSNISGLNSSSCNTSVAGSGQKLEGLIKTVINIFSVIVGSVAVIMIIFGGFKYITSGGSSDGVSGAKNTILYAIVGLVIVAFAQIIVQFVLQRIV